MRKILFVILIANACAYTCVAQKISLENRNVHVEWEKKPDGFHLTSLKVIVGGKPVSFPAPSGEFTVLYSRLKPDSTPMTSTLTEEVKQFPGDSYRYITGTWQNNLKPVPMNTAGQAFHFFPSDAKQDEFGSIALTNSLDIASIESVWKLDPVYKHDVIVTMKLTARKAGYYSLATPTLGCLKENELTWGILPGYHQGRNLQHNLELSYAYGMGIPDKPIVFRERTASTLCPLLTWNGGITLGVIPAPGTGRDPWINNASNQKEWKLGLSLMNRRSVLSPTLYHPVLGEKGSYLKEGESTEFSFRYSIQKEDWFTVYKHAIYDIYKFGDFRTLKTTHQSLTGRIFAMRDYLVNDSTSMWRIENFQNAAIGAQAYLGGVVGSNHDAMKNSDYGAMWMLATVMNDSILKKTRLPFARNFKLKQQQAEPGFFQGASIGQYYLSESRKFVEEWGTYVEPIALTYYSMLDIGNIVLFSPDDQELKDRLRLGADRLLTWQFPDGHWEVGYDRASQAIEFKDIKDFRPTFYGLVVAYRTLGDKKYLDAAVKGADWFINEGASKGYFLGVCGDTRFAPDFATGQSAQALLDLYDLTKNEKYKAMAIEIARIYTASVYTHPIASREKKQVKGTVREDWEISQVGLSFEHGGSIGSANGAGPILLASHAGLFVRMFGLTGDSLFIDMARAAANGRDAFVDPKTGVASYYWNAMNLGAGPFPHHAWWQVGWLTDYLMAEAEVRSHESIVFPKGFVTPKVGAHKSIGFAPGKVFGTEASLMLRKNMITVEDPYVDYYAASAPASRKVFVMLLNDDDEKRTCVVELNPAELLPDTGYRIRSISVLDATGSKITSVGSVKEVSVKLPAYGMVTLEINY